MIFRKPYAFLIKNFRKIHFALIFLCAYIFYKHLQTYNFVKEYVNLEAYSSILESIDGYTSFLSYFCMFLVIVIALLLMITLMRKQKPWKLYLIIVGEYILMLFAFSMTTSFFHTYDNTTAVTEILVVRDLLLLSSFPQYLVFIILFIRATGMDLNKFSFTTDKEFLEMDSSDREEVEVSFELDKNTILRNFRKLKRNFRYFFIEHKYILTILFTFGFLFIAGYTYYYFGIVHKVYKEGQILRASDYEINILHAYLTDKDYRGTLLDKDHYIILELSVKNNGSKRVMDVERFHLINHDQDIISNNLYDNEFKDLGNPYTKLEFKPGKTYQFLLIFKAKEELDISKFNLFYQEYISANKTYLRKIKLNLEDLRTIHDTPEVSLNKEVEMKILDKTKKVEFNQMQLGPTFSYNYYSCDYDFCGNQVEERSSDPGYQMLKVDFTSLDFNGEQFIDFSENYGRIKYKIGKKWKTIDMDSALTKKPLNKSLYLKVPEEVTTSSEIKLEYTIRNNRYTFRLR